MTKRKAKTSPRADYTRQASGCMVYTVEVILRHADTTEDIEELTRALDTMRGFGAAEIVQVDTVVEDWDKACKILIARAIT